MVEVRLWKLPLNHDAGHRQAGQQLVLHLDARSRGSTSADSAPYSFRAAVPKLAGRPRKSISQPTRGKPVQPRSPSAMSLPLTSRHGSAAEVCDRNGL